MGTGFATGVHLPGFRLVRGVEVVAICSASRDRAHGAAARFGIPRATDDYRELVGRDDVDLVDVCTPTRSHYDITIAAIEAGKHVLCEKPVAMTAAEAAEMADRAEAAGVVNAVNHEMRYAPARRHLRRLVDDGFLGDVRFVDASVLVDYAVNPRMEPH